MTCLVTLFDCKLQVFKTRQIDHFWHFLWTFVHPKCKHSSLRSQCWMRLFVWFSNITYDPKRFEISKFLGHPVLKSFLHKINAFEERKLFVIGETMPLERLQLFPQNTLKKWRRGNKRFPSLFSIHIFNICPTIFLLLCLMIMKAVAELSFMVGRFH